MKTETQTTEVILEEQHQGLRSIIQTLVTETVCSDIFIYMGEEDYQDTCNIVIGTNDWCIKTMGKCIKDLSVAFDEDEELEELDDIDREDLSIIKQLFIEMKKVHYRTSQGLKTNLEFGV